MKKITLLLMLCLLPGFIVLDAKTVYYVKVNGTGEGTSWNNASGSIQEMIDKAGTDDEVWVAAGTYYPTKKNNQIDERSKTFLLKNGVHLYGGFAGNEASIDKRIKSDRNGNGKIEAWEFTRETVLSGNIDGVEDVWTKKETSDGTNKGWYWKVSGNENNCYRVVTCYSSLSIDTRFDGFTVREGHHTNSSEGAGIYAQGKLTIANCEISRNMSVNTSSYNFAGGGGGIYYSVGSVGTTAMVNGCLITNNAVQASGKSHDALGGGIYIAAGDMKNCIITDNSTHSLNAWGGGVYLSGSSSSASAYACIIYNNSCNASNLNIEKSSNALAAGGGIYSNTGNVKNCCVTNNHIFAYSDAGTASCMGGGVYSSGTTKRNAYIDCSTVVNNSVENRSSSWTVSNYNIDENRNLSQNFIRSTSFIGMALTGQQHLELIQADWQLKVGSQYIDVTNADDSWILNGTDLAGNPRVYNGKLDFGAYEYHGNSSGIKDLSQTNITLSANPAKDILSIRGLQVGEMLYFYNLNSQLILSHKATGDIENIPISHLSPGIYFVKVNNRQTLKWIKK
ncbi:MAG: T9SS type A sorting domain-containing protein [Tannerellaceae bacterium]|jgi:hypothetical protein|nr:T9SS type A sorting domain-containing protein [Tannerellaceae bacterium]